MKLFLLLLIICFTAVHSMRHVEQIKNLYGALETKISQSLPGRSLLEKKQALNLAVGFASFGLHLYSSYLFYTTDNNDVDTIRCISVKITSVPIACATLAPILFFAKRSLDHLLADEEENEENIAARVYNTRNNLRITR